MIGEIKIILGLFLILLFSAGDLKQVPKLAGLLGCITPVNGQIYD